ncbi:MAG: glycoside hydrolase family 3 C-terminal domain-containing protein [Sphingobium sp.]|nr:glycoside hydrolase family 3 C-terminal domain-containing protein [Sphingobium sp.]
MHRKTCFSLAALCLAASVSSIASAQAADQGADKRPAALSDTGLDAEARADAVIRAMTLEEKAAQLGNFAPAIPRLGIPAYNWWNEGLHGVARAGEATVFPQAIGMAATWDTPLIHRMGDIVSTEFRAKYLATKKPDGSADWYRGLTVWSPNINIFRDPRWGRGQETYGEDPFLTGAIGVAYITGLQGDNPDRIKVGATAKHYAVHSGPESSRHKDDIFPSAHDLEDTYLPAFRRTVTEAKVESVMCAYNGVNGIPACASNFLMNERLRRDWGFRGHVVSDCGAAANIYREEALHWVKTPEEAVEKAFEAGMDVICGDFRAAWTTEAGPIANAVKSGKLPETVVDLALRRLFVTRIKLGLFDPAGKQPFADIKADAAPDHRPLAREVADKSMVLLKNDGLLPLKGDPRKIAVVGPNANAIDVLEGNYNGTPIKPTTVLAGIRARWPKAKVTFAQGVGLIGPTTEPMPAAVLCQDARCSKRGLTAKVYAGSDGKTEGTPKQVRVDPLPRQIWGQTANVGSRDETTEWTGYLKAPESGDYRFKYAGEDGYGVWVDGKLVHEEGRSASEPGKGPGVINLKAGTHAIRITAAQRGVMGDQSLSWTLPHMNGDDAVRAARDADLVVFVGGLSPRIEGEEMRVDADGFFGGDRTAIDLPKPQQALLERVVAAGKPTVLVMMNGSAVAVNWADKNVPAILEAWYPGVDGGAAVAGILAGDTNPAGRLPVTFYRSLDGLPEFKDYKMEGRTYRYHKGEVLYPFGHGLSYTRFGYAAVSASQPVVNADGAVTISANVTNAGQRDGEEVVQLYLTRPGLAGAPIRQLAGFQRIVLKAGETRTVQFTLSGRTLSTVDPGGVRKVVAGTVEAWVGGGQPVARDGMAMAPGGAVRFDIKGEMALPK